MARDHDWILSLGANEALKDRASKHSVFSSVAFWTDHCKVFTSFTSWLHVHSAEAECSIRTTEDEAQNCSRYLATSVCLDYLK
jgi:hypothetical protein